MRVTIHDVARRAGVSVKTVSRAINDHPDVSAATKAAVQETVRTLGFRPSAAARRLRSGRSGMIGLLIPELLNPHYAEVARYMQIAAREAGYVLVISNTDYDPHLALTEAHTFIANNVDGLISMLGRTPDSVRVAVEAAQVPLVGSDDDDDLTLLTVGGALGPKGGLYAGMYTATRYLISLGHRRLAYLTETLDIDAVRVRLDAFYQALSDHDVPADPSLLVTSAYLQTHKLEGGYQAMGQLLDAGHRLTAVCTSSDLIAIGALRALRERGISVPADVSVVGYDDILQASFTDPPLTTVHTASDVEGKRTLHRLLHRIDPAQWPEPLPGSAPVLMHRASTGPASP